MTDPAGDDKDATVHHGNHAQAHMPLSWLEARRQLRSTLRQYADTPPTVHRTAHFRRREFPRIDTPYNSHWQIAFVQPCLKYLDHWLARDFDILLAFFLSAGLLVLSVFSYTQRVRSGDEGGSGQGSTLNARADPKTYKAQIASSVLLMSGSFLSIIISHRRRQTSSNDDFISKRRAVLSFLQELEDLGDESWCAQRHSLSENDENDERRRGSEKSNRLKLSGTPLTDVYSVYRLPSHKNDEKCELSGRQNRNHRQGEWHKIPALLLVKGDYIALQVGDNAPARCERVSSNHFFSNVEDCESHKMGDQDSFRDERLEEHDTMSTNQNGETRTSNAGMMTFHSGERLTNEKLGSGQISDDTMPTLPPRRLTLPPQSKDLLDLCKTMNIFIIWESPASAFLYREGVEHRSPQIHRKGRAVRAALQVFALTLLALTTLLIFVRPGITTTDLSLLLPLPIFAALGVLPVVTPLCLFLFEVIGTSRILYVAHQFTSRTDSSHDDTTDDGKRARVDSHSTKRFIRYCVAVVRTRLNTLLQTTDNLLDIPPASAYLLEKMGAVTALALIDDELASENFSTPQQLLIPSGNGLKLLDLCPDLGDDAESFDSEPVSKSKKRTKSTGSSNDSDSDDSDEEQQYQHTSARRTLQALRRRYKRKVSGSTSRRGNVSPRFRFPLADDNEVQFEDPLWWQHLPSLKCIGLACLLVGGDDDDDDDGNVSNDNSHANQLLAAAKGKVRDFEVAQRTLVEHISEVRSRSHLLSLAECIGFSTAENSFGPRGDVSPFIKRRRLDVVATRLVKDRSLLDRHQIGLEESRNWGLLRPDSTSLIVQDQRSEAYQLLTVGDPSIVVDLCVDSWQGASSTISPLSNADRQCILDTSNQWSLSDLDVAAFSYTPIPSLGAHGGIGVSSSTEARTYLVDNRPAGHLPLPQKDVAIDENWAMVKNQIFLGLLGSAVIPRKEIEPFIEDFTAAGIRFVYFSPRNMRRTKELASQMGIDVAWNCAISLRALDDGQDDPHRMTSTYADWDVNAKLPHGVNEVKRHLEEVDNVPLLVSLYTDATKETTTEMVDVFQIYHDTVLSIGLSHLSQNERIFSAADMSIAIDVLTEDVIANSKSNKQEAPAVCAKDGLHPVEVSFVTSLTTHSCVFNLLGSSSISYVPAIIAESRAALEAATSAGFFVATGCISFSLLLLFCPCTVATAIPMAPAIGCFLYLQLLLPLMGVILSMSEADGDSMNRVPPKNDKSVVFAEGEGNRMFLHAMLRAVPPAVASQLAYLTSLGPLVAKFEPNLINACTKSIIRCEALKAYSGPARTSASSLMISQLMLCTLVFSAGFVFRTKTVRAEKPWQRNKIWVWGVAAGFLVIVLYLALSLEPGSLSALPWYFFVLAFTSPLVCLVVVEVVKQLDSKHEVRAERLRRLQFETRLGMWSPK